ncbi:hypothetical protein BHU61_00105 [Macrococcus epidermidis]|uniref:Uncharacterized protein n=1 Tax=Macrococcus epidermidis TaxID=1902580 RepID=A0A327ZU28_9STAP|nr:hypothetical protein [Macrococcus epidermidis]RAK45880.1 hypothetical protein BHU61_00105 [Macrococcus epidermidis]
MKKQWGTPTTKKVYRSSITIPEYNYGPLGNLKIKGQANGSVAESKAKVDQILIATKSHTKHEYKKVMKTLVLQKIFVRVVTLKWFHGRKVIHTQLFT